MTDDLAIRLTRVLARAACAVVECAAMAEANRVAYVAGRLSGGTYQAPYLEADFRKVVDTHGLGWNDVVGDTRP
jgi:hypothetical protein